VGEPSRSRRERARRLGLVVVLVFLVTRLFVHGVASDLPSPRPTGLVPVRLDPRTAHWRELALLPGLGEVGARALSARMHGLTRPWTQADLLAVSGIGPATVERLLPFLAGR